MQQSDRGRKKSQVISIQNNIDTFDQTMLKLRELSNARTLNVDAFRIQLSSYAEQYVSGIDREEFFKIFKSHNILTMLLDLIKRNKDSNLFVAAMKSLSIICFNLTEKEEVKYFLSNECLSEIIEFKLDKTGLNESVEVYIQFLKSLALKFTEHKCVSLFYNAPLFPFMWRVFSFYNQNQHLSRTTVKSIIAEIVRIPDFTVKAYLNNFPTILFLSLLSRYMMDALTYTRKQKNMFYLDVVSDQMSFIIDLITHVSDSTKAYIINSLLYYPIKYLWNSFQSKQAKTKNILLSIFVILFNTSNDTSLMQLLYISFFQKRIPKQLFDFLKTPSKQLSLYSFNSLKPQFQGCRKVIQTHCQRTFNNYNTQLRQIGDQIIQFKSLDKQQSLINKSINTSKQLFTNLWKSYSWEGYVMNQMKVLSQAIGASVKLYSPISHTYTNNIYNTFHIYKNTQGNYQNLFYSSLLKNMMNQPYTINTYLLLTINILKKPSFQSIHILISQTFLKQSADLIKCLDKYKSLNGINYLLESIILCLKHFKPQSKSESESNKLSQINNTIKQQLNQLCKQASDTLLQSQFNDWEDYLQIFTNQQRKIQTLKSSSNEFIAEIDYDIIDEQPILSDKILIHYYYLIRNTILLLKQQPIITIQSMIQERESKNTPTVCQLQNIQYMINNRRVSNKIKDRMLIIRDKQTSQIVYQIKLKRLNMKDLWDQIIEIKLVDQVVKMEFLSGDDKMSWVEEICSISKRMEEIEILTISDVVEKVPRL